MSFTENTSINLQELISTLLKLSNNENPLSGSTVIKMGNELVSLNISKIPEPAYNMNLNSQEPLTINPIENLNLQHFISKDTFQESPSPKSLNEQNSLNTADFNSIQYENPKIDSIKTNEENENENNILRENKNVFQMENKKEETNNDFKSFGGGFEEFNSNIEISFGRFSLMPRHDQENKEESNLQLEKDLTESKVIEETETQKLNKEKCVDLNINQQTKSALDFINSFQMNNPNPNLTLENSQQKPFSSNFFNEMKNIPISDNNKINPYAYVNVFSTPKTAEILNEKDTDEKKQPVFINELEKGNKNNISSPFKTKKPSNNNQINIQPTSKPVSNTTNVPIKQAINTIIPTNKKKIIPSIKPNLLKKPILIKEKNGIKSNIIKEVNEEIHSNDDSKERLNVSGGKPHKNSADLEKINIEEKKEKNSLKAANDASESESEKEENKKQLPLNKKDISNSKIIEVNEERANLRTNDIKMELPENEMEENLKFLMEKADRTNELGEKMFQTINTLLKYKQNLEIKEKTLKEKEKIFVEFEQKSKSSTQWSYDTKSTLNGADPLKALLEEFYKEKKNDSFLNEPPSEADIHFLFLYSSPLITFFRDKEGKIGKRPIYNEIDIVNEWKTLQEILPESKRELKFMKSSASLEKIGVIFDRSPLAIHFCGHGVKNNEQNFGLVSNEEVGDFLIFEDQYGGADFVSCMTLSKLLNKLKKKLHFAFVASCHSKLVGEVFLNAGALHVICVKREERILDKACQIFTKAFYNACFTGKKTICEAFEIAKDQIRASANLPKGEENKFVMLIKRHNNQSIYDEHKCVGWIDLGPGSFQDLTWKPEFNHLPSQVENFLGRNEIMHEVITLILTNRFITIKGIPGIGKSSLAKEVGRYIYERNHFKNGVIYLQLISYQTNEAVTSCLDSKVFPNSSFKQIESKKENNLKMLYQIIEILRNKEVLIIMDNIDMVLANFAEKEKFQSLLDYLLSSCNNLKILITSRTPVGGVPLADCIERLYNLSHLNNEDAKNLFLLRSPRPIYSQEIADLLLLIPDENYFDEDKNIKPKEKTFSNHQIMELFGGHPQAITLGAALLYERSLKDLFNYLRSNSIVNVLHLDPYLSEREKKTFNSLKASLDASWAILYEKNKIAAKFFSVLGLLPGGASEEEFHAIWGENWQEHCDVLLRSSLLIKTEKNNHAFFSLFPFMTKYAEEHLRIKDKREFHNKIMEHYHQKIQKIFKNIGTLSTESNKAVDELQDVEFNIRACIFRELSFQGSQELEKSLYENYSNLNVGNSASVETSLKPMNESYQNQGSNNNKTNEDDDFVSLTKENLEMHQKRYEFIATSKLISNHTSKKSPKSTSPICINENLANVLKSQSNNNEVDDSEEKDCFPNEESHKDKGISPLNEEKNTKEIIEREEKVIKQSRLAIIPKNTDLITKEDATLLNKQNLQDLDHLKSESNPSKFTKKIEIPNNELCFEKENDHKEKTNENSILTDIEKINIAKNKLLCQKDPKDKKIFVSTTKNSLSSTARPSNSLTTNDNPTKVTPKTSFTKLNPKPKVIAKFQNSKQNSNNKITLINKILIYYSSTLFLSRRYIECNKMIIQGLQLSDKMNDRLALANFKRISGSVQYIKKNFPQALKEFMEAEEIFKEIGCSLGICISEAAIGFIKYLEGEYNQAKNYLESALKIYDSLNHIFGIHFMNRWLANVKRKIPGFGTQTKKHIEAAQNIIRNKNKLPTKNNEKTTLTGFSKHKGGYFILRWMGDGISIFIEAAFKIDIEGKKTKNKLSVITTRTSNLPSQISASEDMVFKNELQIPSLVKSESQKKSQTNKTKKEEEKNEKNIVNRPAVAKKKK